LRDRLIQRLEAIAAAVAARPSGLALLGLGSCADLARLDDHSDLDFFVIVEPGAAPVWRDHLDWLAEAAPIAWAHRNTADGWKTLSEDGVLCEFAVFEPWQLPGIPYAPGAVIWAREGFDTGQLTPQRGPEPVDRAWRAREALSDLMVGLMRLRRGETASAWHSVCVYAAGNALLALAEDPGSERPQGAGAPDPFDPLRRIETIDPPLAARAAAWRGPDLTTAARSILGALVERFGEDAMSRHVRARLDAVD
jgi:lincosamide nucleotidyltransferase B/F